MSVHHHPPELPLFLEDEGFHTTAAGLLLESAGAHHWWILTKRPVTTEVALVVAAGDGFRLSAPILVRHGQHVAHIASAETAGVAATMAADGSPHWMNLAGVHHTDTNVGHAVIDGLSQPRVNPEFFLRHWLRLTHLTAGAVAVHDNGLGEPPTDTEQSETGNRAGCSSTIAHRRAVGGVDEHRLRAVIDLVNGSASMPTTSTTLRRLGPTAGRTDE